MVIFLGIVTGLALVALVLVFIDRNSFFSKMTDVEIGMTGKEVEEATGLKVEIVEIDKENNMYTGIVRSKFRLFREKLIFLEGGLINKMRE